MKTKKQTPKVRTLSLSRLYNLGNYEHVKWEVSVDVGDALAADVLKDLRSILAALKPVKKPHRYDYYIDLLAKESITMTEQQKADIAEATEALGNYNIAKNRHLAAIARLDNLGGKSTHTDAKQDWDIEEDAPW